MKYYKTLLPMVVALAILLGSGVLQGIAWCANSICTTCGDSNNQNRDFDTALMGGAAVGASASSSQTPASSSQSSTPSGSSRNYVKKGSGSE